MGESGAVAITLSQLITKNYFYGTRRKKIYNCKMSKMSL